MNLDQTKLPLYDALLKHASTQPISYHVPGHKSGSVFPLLSDNIFSSILKIDMTEINGLDDLHDPEEVIDEAQRLAADIYGVDATYFLVNGSTVGNLASVLSLCDEDDMVLVQRDSHKSILNAVKLSKVRPVYLAPTVDEETNISIGLSIETIEEALKAYPNVKALIVTNPTYYGASIDIDKVVQLAHSYCVPVIVDEAHGAHFIVGPPFPRSAVQAGADIVIHSAHKTLPAMTMASYLHVQGHFVDQVKLSSYLSILQSSSPSYVLMASLDIARYYVAHFRSSHVRKLIKNIEMFCEEINSISGLKVVPLNSQDPLKVLIEASFCTGYDLQRMFEQKGIYSELADSSRVLFVLPLSEKLEIEETIERMKKAIQSFSNQENQTLRNEARFSFVFPSVSSVLSYKQMKSLEKTTVAIEHSEGLFVCKSVIPYPPGIPILLEGEQVNRDHINYILQLKEAGAKVQGGHSIYDGYLEVFLI
ncbi:aminotransferase class I/II-fold pyridoxal phosphate-dependent enzyme [Bacillus sp. CGMCC 1.16541]|uniref:aminotransferase class I/II-fold pyridoxal phosphate-dependent enzyme n=1 Tax=Bacillus sp. CGMCC 1.16541 TaxID=2185143 RepID=UPI0013A5654F|nr:aminotransferase class I/II-fold pyridoxal phosphate-dependent enzyme [Bacillus sp. CGMCC 1.16541]